MIIWLNININFLLRLKYRYIEKNNFSEMFRKKNKVYLNFLKVKVYYYLYFPYINLFIIFIIYFFIQFFIFSLVEYDYSFFNFSEDIKNDNDFEVKNVLSLDKDKNNSTYNIENTKVMKIPLRQRKSLSKILLLLLRAVGNKFVVEPSDKFLNFYIRKEKYKSLLTILHFSTAGLGFLLWIFISFWK